MPISRIKTDGIQDDAVTQPKIKENITLDGTEFVRVPFGTTAQRPSSVAGGQLRFNTDIGTLEQYNTNTSSWQAIDSPPIISSLAYAGSLTGANPAGGETITLTGINFKTGFTISIGGTSAATTTFVNATTVRFTTPVKTAGDYDITFVNSNGLQATLTNGISYNGLPAFSTAAGNVGSIVEDVAMSTITIVAAEPDGGTLAFSVTSGALPTGVTLGSANGQLTGTPNANVTSDTTFNFTVTATDDENQTNARAFNLIVLRPIYATQINNSLRLVHSDNSSLTKTWGTNATDGTRGTMSAWVKRGILTNGTGNHQYWFHSGTGTDNSGHMDIKFNNDDAMSIGRYSDTPFAGTAVHRDISAWMHIVVVWNTTDASAANNKVVVYVNGTALPGSYANISQNDVLPWTKNGNALYIGKHATVNRPFDGYIADIHLIDGQALAPTAFAEEYYGVWTPKAYSGTYGNNGFKLDFANSADIGNDVSGNNNDLTPGSINARDVTPDSPTTNFATYNPLILRRDVTATLPEFTRGNLKASYPNAGGNQTYSFGTHSASSGKWYYEVYMTATGSNTTVGIGAQADINASGAAAVIYRNTGAVSTSAGGSKNNDGASYANGDIIGIAYDLDNGIVKYFKNGTLQSTVTGITTTNTYLPYTRGTTSENNFANFGQDSTFDGLTAAGGNADGNGIGNFKYAVPSGHLALCSKNLSESTINTVLDDRPEDYFKAVKYTGDGGTQAVAVGFQPDLTWIKRYDSSTTSSHRLYDSLSYGGPYSAGQSGAMYHSTNTSAAASTGTANGLIALTSTGFTVNGTGGDTNASGFNYISWNWKAGGAPTATNSASAGDVPTSGSIMIDGSASTSALPGTIAASQISANTKSKFSIVKWAGNATSGATIAHGLGVAPEMIIVHTFSGTNNADRPVYHYIRGNSTAGNASGTAAWSGASAGFWNNTTPSNTVFTVGNDQNTNKSGSVYVAYCFASVDGFCKVGGYVGTGQAAAGAFAECGFKPAFMYIKNAEATESWYNFDNALNDDGNPYDRYMNPNHNGAGGTGSNRFPDVTATGFKLRGGDTSVNGAGAMTIFLSYAEDPTKYSEAE